jgi:hypothetical protein
METRHSILYINEHNLPEGLCTTQINKFFNALKNSTAFLSRTEDKLVVQLAGIPKSEKIQILNTCVHFSESVDFTQFRLYLEDDNDNSIKRIVVAQPCMKLSDGDITFAVVKVNNIT